VSVRRRIGGYAASTILAIALAATQRRRPEKS